MGTVPGAGGAYCMTILAAVFLFGLVIFVHELGHFIVAKLSGVKVLKFSLGFGPSIISKKVGETEYALSAVPLGGYVKMHGEDPDADENTILQDPERSFKAQSLWKRALIVFSGPFFNMMTAVAIFFVLYLTGIPMLLPVVGEVVPGSPAESARMEKGDRVIEVNGAHVKQWSDLTDIIYESPGKQIALKILRGSDHFTVHVTPESKTVKDVFGEDKVIGLIGVKSAGETAEVREDLPTALQHAFVKTWDITVLTLTAVVKMIQRIIPADSIGGPIMIFQMAEKQASAGAMSFFVFAAVISINLGILNLLPIPVLDGGHLLFMGIEAIRKKPLSERTMIISQKVGVILLVGLMAFAMYNDLFRIFTKQAIP
ncbi:MAG: regulator of sigma E protease [Nitrospirae bacterium]|nr:MAG: regulator of sigma E protease [Nitrospirota bacterium]